MTMQNLRELLAMHMKIHNMDGVEVGRLINLNRVHVHKFLRGEQGLNGERVLKLLDLLGFEVVRKQQGLRKLSREDIGEMMKPSQEEEEATKLLLLLLDKAAEGALREDFLLQARQERMRKP